MKLKVGVYNVEWMSNLFKNDGTPILTGEKFKKSKQLATVIKSLNLDFLGIVEGPDTRPPNGKKTDPITAAIQLENWVKQFELNLQYKGVNGNPSSGRQELCALYNSSKIKVEFTPTIDEENQFDKAFLVDTTDRLIKEQYQHYRPPLELTITSKTSSKEFSKVIVAHAKSKGIFSPVDYAKFEQISVRNRMKLYAECMSIRLKCDDYIKSNSEVIVMGDINDGIGMDFYENKFSKSAVEILLGDVWNIDKILTSVLQKPKWTSKGGWKPSSGRFKDRITEYTINVLIDHIFVSKGLSSKNGKVWHPSEMDKDSKIQNIKDELENASDHFPITAEIENDKVD